MFARFFRESSSLILLFVRLSIGGQKKCPVWPQQKAWSVYSKSGFRLAPTVCGRRYRRRAKRKCGPSSSSLTRHCVFFRRLQESGRERVVPTDDGRGKDGKRPCRHNESVGRLVFFCFPVCAADDFFFLRFVIGAGGQVRRSRGAVALDRRPNEMEWTNDPFCFFFASVPIGHWRSDGNESHDNHSFLFFSPCWGKCRCFFVCGADWENGRVRVAGIAPTRRRTKGRAKA